MFGERLKALRNSKGFTQAELAEKLGIPQKTYCNYERNVNEPSASMLIKIAVYFNVDLNYLYGYSPNEETNKKIPPAVKDDREKYKEMLSRLSNSELKELEKFTSYLVWKRRR